MTNYNHSLEMLKVALDCYMGKDLQEDSNLSRPVKQALQDLEEAINKVDLLEKALLLACEKISFGEETEEPETQEEAQDNYIYTKYTRPKELMDKYIRKAKENGK